MPLILHKVLTDGSWSHEEFSQQVWERNMHDREVATQWAHPAEDCFVPAERILGRRIELVKTSEVVPLGAEPNWREWRADYFLVWTDSHPRMTFADLSEISGLCLLDCMDLLLPPRDRMPEQEKKMVVDKKGQGLLF